MNKNIREFFLAFKLWSPYLKKGVLPEDIQMIDQWFSSYLKSGALEILPIIGGAFR